MFEKLIQDGVFLRLLEERHAAEIFAVVDREREYLREWLPWVDLTTDAGYTANFVRISLEQFARGEGIAAGFWVESEFAGGIGTHKIDWLNRRVEIGYWIASGFQGRGIVTAGCRALIDHAFDELQLNRVEIHCATGNGKSCAIPKRLGFQFEGVLREAQLLNGAYVDINVYSMLCRQWRAASPESRS
jgi:ribosomal-protein-serine acetyltransferase